ncbi:hypothetical protein RKD26_003163 [Streptomyces calvus]
MAGQTAPPGRPAPGHARCRRAGRRRRPVRRRPRPERARRCGSFGARRLGRRLAPCPGAGAHRLPGPRSASATASPSGRGSPPGRTRRSTPASVTPCCPRPRPVWCAASPARPPRGPAAAAGDRCCSGHCGRRERTGRRRRTGHRAVHRAPVRRRPVRGRPVRRRPVRGRPVGRRPVRRRPVPCRPVGRRRLPCRPVRSPWWRVPVGTVLRGGDVRAAHRGAVASRPRNLPPYCPPLLLPLPLPLPHRPSSSGRWSPAPAARLPCRRSLWCGECRWSRARPRTGPRSADLPHGRGRARPNRPPDAPPGPRPAPGGMHRPARTPGAPRPARPGLGPPGTAGSRRRPGPPAPTCPRRPPGSARQGRP